MDIILWLFLLFGLLWCPALPASAHSHCSNIVPGIIDMTYGYDIASVDLFADENSRGKRSPVLEFSCSEKKVWVNPSTKLKYDQPDQVQSINTKTSGILTQIARIYGNLEGFKRSFGISFSIGGIFGYGSFSNSVRYKEAKERMVKNNESYAETYAFTNVMQINLRDYEDLKLTKGFRNFIDKKLIVPYDQNPAIYDEFIDTYGTHIFFQAQFGGKLSQRTFIKNSYISESKKSEIGLALKAKLSSLLNVKRSVNSTNSKTNEKFESNSETRHQFFGGYIDPTQMVNVSSWMKSLHVYPCIIRASLVGIGHFVQNATTRNELEKAVLFRQVKVYLHDLMSTIELAKFGLLLDDWRKISSIEILLDNPKTTVDKLSQAGRTIHSLFVRLPRQLRG